jgi:hypothetical protein
MGGDFVEAIRSRYADDIANKKFMRPAHLDHIAMLLGEIDRLRAGERAEDTEILSAAYAIYDARKHGDGVQEAQAISQLFSLLPKRG